MKNEFANNFAWTIFQNLSFQNLQSYKVGGAHVLELNHQGIDDEIGLNVVRAILGPSAVLSIRNPGGESGNLKRLSVVFESGSVPAIPILGSQFPGWTVILRFGKRKARKSYLGVISGPIRLISQEPKPMFKALQYRENGRRAVLVLDNLGSIPTEFIRYISKRCDILPHNIGVLSIGGNTNPGAMTVASRTLEMVIHKLVVRDGLTPRQIVWAMGSAPIVPTSSESTAIETYAKGIDAIVYAGEATLQITGVSDIDLAKITKNTVSASSKNYGRNMMDLIREAEEATEIDTSFLAPAKLTLDNKDSGVSHSAGETRYKNIKNVLV